MSSKTLSALNSRKQLFQKDLLSSPDGRATRNRGHRRGPALSRPNARSQDRGTWEWDGGCLPLLAPFAARTAGTSDAGEGPQRGCSLGLHHPEQLPERIKCPVI